MVVTAIVGSEFTVVHLSQNFAS